jgi:NTE family protein
LARERVLIDLALQGGGSHGAFTWGVLDRLLLEDWLQIEGVSGTSAGAMNAAVMISGHAKNGAEGARAALEQFWRNVARAAAFSPFQRSFLDVLCGRWTLDYSPAVQLMYTMTQLVSPYDMVFLGGNPLLRVLEESVDFAALRGARIRLFVTATNVRTGRTRVFRNEDISIPALLASACLPQFFPAVEIEGEAYWDGGFAGNPTMFPLIAETESDDTILIPINPIERRNVPRRARDIVERVNEISFNTATLKELKMLALLRRVADPSGGEGRRWAEMRMHVVNNDAILDLGASSKLNAEWAFLTMLRDEGRRAAEAFLAAHGDDLGKRSSLDIDQLLEGV